MKKHGFTLVELLVTIAIIATLSAILLPNFMGARQKAADSKKIQDMTAMKNALRLYFNDNQVYPGAADNTLYTNLDTTLVPKYMMPVGVGYSYYRTNTGDGFQLCAWLDSGQGDDDINSQVRCGIGTVSVCGNGPGAPVDKWYAVCAN
jgi:prepilin-type N-terminal cleavage/methylation domain-containing protein